METIIYKGQQIEVEKVAYVHNDFVVWSHGDMESNHQGEESLYRDIHGRYYLSRVLWWLDTDGHLRRKGSGRQHLHRISLKAAALWAAVRMNSQGDAFKRDLNALLSQQPTPDAAGILFQDADAVTVPLTLPSDLYQQILAMGAYDERGGLSETIVHSMEGEVQAWLDTEDSGPRPEEFLEQYLEEHPLPSQAGQSSTLEAAARYAAKYGRTLHEFIADALAMIAQDAPARASSTETAPHLEARQGSPLRTQIGIGGGQMADVREHAQQLGQSEEQALADLLGKGLYVKHCGHLLVELDHVALPLLRRYQGEHPELEAADVVNGLVVNWCEAMFQILEGRDDGTAMEQAKRRRLGETSDVIEPGRPAQPPAYSRGYPVIILNNETDALVDCFRTLCPWSYQADDIVNGCTKLFLEMALANHEEAVKLGKVNGLAFHDGEWGSAEEAACEALQLRTGEGARRKDGRRGEKLVDEEMLAWFAERRAGLLPPVAESSIPPADFQPRRYRHTPADVILLAAAKPEEEPLPEEEHADDEEAGEPRPIRAVLLDVVADWRKSAGAIRIRAQGEKVLEAPLNLPGQADLLEQCADTLAAALDGKEGR